MGGRGKGGLGAQGVSLDGDGRRRTQGALGRGYGEGGASGCLEARRGTSLPRDGMGESDHRSGRGRGPRDGAEERGSRGHESCLGAGRKKRPRARSVYRGWMGVGGHESQSVPQRGVGGLRAHSVPRGGDGMRRAWRCLRAWMGKGALGHRVCLGAGME
uniref:Uncharacterized protein n=1 Tax=Solanum lycopersicum TaxID=4081 RepID=K4CFU7_SOLLC